MLLMACMAPWAVGQTREIVYQKVTTAPDDWTAGSYLLVYDNSKAATNSTTTSGSTIYLNTVSVTVESNTIENPNGAEVITLELYTTGKYYIKNSEGKFLKAIRSGSGSTKYPQFSWVTTSDAYNCVWQFAYNNGNITLKWENNNDYKMAVSGNYITLASSASNFSLFAQANVQIDYPKPTGLDVTDLGSTTATLSWTAPTSSPKEGYSLTGYEYKEANAASWSSVITTTSCDLEGLTANTEYTYQVVAVYTNNNDETDIQDSDPVSITFTTDCAELSVPTQTWNFDDGTMPDCWTIASTYVYSGNTYPRVYNNGSGYSYSTSYALQFGGTTSTVLMPAINETVNGKTLSFYTRVGYVSGTPQLLIGYIDNTNAFITKETVTVTASFTKQEIDLTGFPSDIRKIALHSNISSSQIYVDDIKIEVTSGCKPVKNLSVGTITANSAKLKWTAGNAETNWKLQYKTSAAENYSTVNVSSTDLDSDGYYTLGSLADNTTYNWQVAAWCDPTVPTAITDYVSGTNFTTIQTPVVVDADHDFSDNFEDANNWVFVNGTQTNKWVIGTAAHNGEGSTKALYISNDGGTTHAYSGTSSTTYVTKSITFAAGTYNFQYDWICNGEKSSYGTVYDYFRVALAPATTTLTAGTTTITYNNVPSGWIALDGGALVQQNSWTTKTVNDVEISSGTYLLVFMWTNDSQVYQVPAGVDNFSITAVSCAAPTALAESNVRSNSATFTWTKGGTETNWTLQYAENNTFSTGLVEVTEGFTIDGTNVSYSATGLKAGQIYYVRVKANCSANDESAFCDAINFTTLAILPPTNLPVSDITTTSARLNWTGVSTNDGHSSYEVCYSTTNSVPSTLTPNENYFTGITATNKTLSGLTSGTTYYAWVRDICGINSTWAAFNSFNTDCENVTTFPFIQDFESLSVNYTIPVCWDNNDGTTTNDNYKWCYTTVTGTSNKGNTNGTGHNNSNCVRFDSYDSSDGETNFLSTPTIVLSDKIVVLEFWYKNPNGGDLSVFINDGSDHGSRKILSSLTTIKIKMLCSDSKALLTGVIVMLTSIWMMFQCQCTMKPLKKAVGQQLQPQPSKMKSLSMVMLQ